jgi:hypothetical protein
MPTSGKIASTLGLFIVRSFSLADANEFIVVIVEGGVNANRGQCPAFTGVLRTRHGQCSRLNTEACACSVNIGF